MCLIPRARPRSLHLERPSRDAEHAPRDDDSRLKQLQLVHCRERDDAQAQGGGREGASLGGGEVREVRRCEGVRR